MTKQKADREEQPNVGRDRQDDRASVFSNGSLIRGRRAGGEERIEPTPLRRLLTTGEAAVYCGLAKNTLEKMRLYGRKDDNAPRFIKLGVAVRYHPDDLDAWIDRNRAITTSEYDPFH